MDVTKLVKVLRDTLQPDQRVQAEQQLTEVHKIIGFVPTLLQIIMEEQIDLPVRQAAVIYFKNTITSYWEEKTPAQPSDPIPFSIHETDKTQVRENIVEAVIRAPPPIRVQLAVVISHLVKQDYPGKWPGIAEKVLMYLQSDQHVTWMGALISLYQLVKNFEYKKPEERGTLNEAMRHILPLIHSRCVQLLPDASEVSVALQKQILKIFYALVQFFLPLDLISKETFTQWMELARQIVDRPVPEETLQVDEEDRPELVWWKCKKWAMHIIARCFERYGSPGNVQKEYKEFSEWYLKNFSAGIYAVLLKLLDQYRQKAYVAPRVLQQTLNYFSQGVGHSITWKLLKPHLPVIIQEILFPLMCHSDEDEELWQTDPVEYIRIKYDVFEEFFSPVTAAQSLLHTAVSKRKEILPKTMGFVVGLLNTQNLEPRQKAGALHVVGAVADVLMRRKLYKAQVEKMLETHVFPAFSAPEGYLRARACWVIHTFSEAKFKSRANLEEAMRLLREAMINDKELPVKVEAAIAIQMLLAEQEKAVDILRPHVQPLVVELLKVLRETENEDLTSVMQKLVCSFIEEITPLAVNITTHLAETFAKVLEGDSDGGDERAIAAMGILNTLETIVTVMEEQPEILKHIEQIVLNVIGLILHHNVIEFYEEMLALLASMTTVHISETMWQGLSTLCELLMDENLDHFTEFYEELLSLIYSLTCENVSTEMWSVFPLLYQLFKNDGFDYFTDMMPALHNYITVDPAGFTSNAQHLEIIYDMCKAVLTGDAGEDAECHAAKLLEVILLQYKNQVDSVIPSFVELVLERLTREVRTSELRCMCLQVVVAALYYDPQLLLTTLEKMHMPNSQETVTAQFLKQWLHDCDCFLGLHDRKICVLGLCCLMDTPANRPAPITQVANQILPAAIMIFNGLKRAYEQRAAEENDESGDEEGDEDDEECVNEELGDDEDEIDEDGEVYMEKLDKFNRSNGVAADDDDDDDSDDLDYDAEAEETALESYETPLDKDNCAVDEYQVFQALMQAIQQRDSAWYDALVRPLTTEQKKELQDVFKAADQRRAVQESKNIEKKGGYSFAQQTVPSAFNFSSPQ